MKTPHRFRSTRTRLGAAAVAVGATLVLAAPGVGYAAQSAQADVSVQAKLTHSQATAKFKANGITWSSSGGCSNRNRSNCTSFDKINSSTVNGVITLKKASRCAIRLTGGTETGHASGTYSHWNGYKVDIGMTSCVTSYVKKHFSSIGGSKWKSGSGNVYYYEGNHWDVTFYNCGGCLAPSRTAG
ncbi:hypothetical protein [Streptomyces sp. NPDC058045]|uniref:hypothetical protein n=1 Tax=Streptomyces sp. NPDC058045 TaxID=3346311 RepID=UPI0036EA91BA